MKKGSLLMRSGVSFRSAAKESQIRDISDACTPGPSKYLKSTPGPSEPAKSTPGPIEPTNFKKKADKEQIAMGKTKRSAKQRIVECSEAESEGDEDSDWTVEADEAAKTAASKGAIEPSETDKERTPKTVEENRKQGALGAAGTRKSTRQRRGVDTMGVS